MPQTPDGRAEPDLLQRGMKVSHLRLLAALVETGQIGAAAAQVNMTQPAASRLLAQLADIVGTPLYDRHARGVTLTEAGDILARQAVEAIKGLDRARQRIEQVGSGLRGHVRIGAVTGPALELLLPALRSARLAYPDIGITVRVDTSDALAEALLADEIDFYLGRIPAGTDARPFSITLIGPENIDLVVRLDHPLVRREGLTLEECTAYDWVMQPPGNLLRRTAESYLLERGLTLPRRVISTTSILFTLALVNDTNAIAPLARAVGQFFIERAALGSRLEVLPVARDMSVVDYGIVARAEDTPTAATHSITKLILAQAEA